MDSALTLQTEPAQTDADAGSARFLSPFETAAIATEWADLAADAVEPNPFYSPWLLAPALKSFADSSVKVAVVRDGRSRLIALAPIGSMRGYSRLPVRYAATWMHPHCFFAAPLVRRGCAAEALAALFDLVEREGAFLRLAHLDADGDIYRAAVAVGEKTGRLCAPSDRYERAMLKGGYATGLYLEETMRAKKRKELRRLRNRLEEEGAVSFEKLTDGMSVDAWTEEFLTLERSGWKGQQQTALASDSRGAEFFAAAIKGAFAEGALRFYRMKVGSRTIAMIANFVEGRAGFSFKIAHDEAYSRFSPGVMIEIGMMKALEAEGLDFIDSCAQEDHPMINSLWRERRAIAALNVSRRDPAGKILFRLLTGLEAASARLRSKKAQEESYADL